MTNPSFFYLVESLCACIWALQLLWPFDGVSLVFWEFLVISMISHVGANEHLSVMLSCKPCYVNFCEHLNVL